MTETPRLDSLNTDEQKDQLISSTEIKGIQEFLTEPAKIKELAAELKSLRDKGEMKELVKSFEQSLTQHTVEMLADAMKTDPDHLKPTADLQNLVLFHASQQGIHIDHTALEDPKQQNIIVSGLIKDLILSSPALQQSLQQARLEHQRQQSLKQLEKDFQNSLTPDRLLALNGIDLSQRPKKLPASLEEIATITPENVGTYLNLGSKVEDLTTATNAVKQFLAAYLQEFPGYQSDLMDTPGTVTGMNIKNMNQRLTYSRGTRELYTKTYQKADVIFQTGQLPPELQNAYLGPDALKVMIKERLISLATPDKQSDFQVFLYEQTRAQTPLGLMLKQINEGSKPTNSAPFLKQVIQAGYDIKTVRVIGETGEKLQQQLAGKSKIQKVRYLENIRKTQPDIWLHPALEPFRTWNLDAGTDLVNTKNQLKPWGLQTQESLAGEKVLDTFTKEYGDFARRMKALEPIVAAGQLATQNEEQFKIDNAISNGQARYYGGKEFEEKRGMAAFEKKYGKTFEQVLEEVKNVQMRITETYIKTLLALKPQPEFVTKGEKIQSPFMPGMMLDFAHKTPEAIMRNTFVEQSLDGWNQFVDDIKNNPARAFANIMACIASVAVLLLTKHPGIAATSSTVAFRGMNGLTQGVIQGIYHGSWTKGLNAFNQGIGITDSKDQFLGVGEIAVDFGADTLETYLGGRYAKMINAKVLGNASGKTMMSKIGRAASERATNDVIGEIGIAQTITNPAGAFFKNLLGVQNSVANGLTSRWGRNYTKSEGGTGSLASALQAASESFGKDLTNPAMLVQMMGHSLLFSGVVSSARASGDVAFKYLPAGIQQKLIAKGNQVQETVQRIEQKLVNNAITIRIEKGVAAFQSALEKRYATVDELVQDHPKLQDIQADIKKLDQTQLELHETMQDASKSISPDSAQAKIIQIASDLGLSGVSMPLHIEASQKALLLKKQGKSEQAISYEQASIALKNLEQRIQDGTDQPVQPLTSRGIQTISGLNPDGSISSPVNIGTNALRPSSQQTADQASVDIKTDKENSNNTETTQTKEKSAEQQAMEKSLGIDVQMDMITTREQAEIFEKKLEAIISNKLLSAEAKSLAREKLNELQAHMQTLPVTAPEDQKSQEPKVIPLQPHSTPSQTGTGG